MVEIPLDIKVRLSMDSSNIQFVRRSFGDKTDHVVRDLTQIFRANYFSLFLIYLTF